MSSKNSTATHQVEILILSVLGGWLCGVAAGFGCGWPPDGGLIQILAVWGAILGLIVFPLLLIALRWRPLGKSMALMLPPSVALAGFGAMTPTPLITLLSIPVFVFLAFMARKVLPDIRTLPDPDLCVKCGYSLKGVSHSPHRRCPECGHVEETRKS